MIIVNSFDDLIAVTVIAAIDISLIVIGNLQFMQIKLKLSKLLAHQQVMFT